MRLKDDVVHKILYFEQAMNDAHTVIDYATAFYESMEYFELPNQLMTIRDTLEADHRYEEAEEIDQI